MKDIYYNDRMDLMEVTREARKRGASIRGCSVVKTSPTTYTFSYDGFIHRMTAKNSWVAKRLGWEEWIRFRG